MALATLSIDIVAKIASLQAGLDAAARAAERNAARIDAAFNRTNKIAGNLGTALKGAFAGFTITALYRSIVGGLDALVDLRDATGASIENLSALEDVALRTGTTFDSMASTLVKFNLSLSNAKPGTDAANVFKALGLSVAELKRLDPAEALHRVAVAFSKFADDGFKGRAMVELFSKGLREAGPLMNELAKQTKLNAAVTTVAAEQAEAFRNQINALSKDLLDATRALGGPVLTALQTFIDKIKELHEWRTKKLQSKMDESIRDEAESIRSRIAVAQEALAQDGQSATARLRWERQLNDALRERELILRGAAGERGGPGGSGGVDPETARFARQNALRSLGDTAVAKGTKEKVSDLQKYIDRLEDATIAALDLNTAERAQIDILSGALGPLTKKQADNVMALARGLDALKEKTFDASAASIEAMKEEIATADALRAAQADSVAELNAILAATPTGQTIELVRQEQLLRQAFDEAKISAELLHEAINTLYGTLPETVKQAMTDLQKLAAEAAQEFEATLGSSIRKALKGDFDGILEDWGAMLLDMAARAAAAKLTKDLFGDAGTTGQIGGWIGALIGSLSAPKASGGPVAPWSMQRVNERGPEGLTVEGKDYLMMGARGGRVTPSSGVGGGVTNLTVNVGAGVSRAEVFAAVQAGMNASRNAMIQSRKRGGVLA